MKTFGQTRFQDFVSVSDQLVGMIKCVTAFPDFAVTPEGCLVQLIAPVVGCITGHVYRCDVNGSGSKFWRDITTSNEIAPDTSGCIFKVNKTYASGKLSRLDMYWTTPSGTDLDPWVKDVVVMQTKTAPQDLNDGLVLLASGKANEYTLSKQAIIPGTRTLDEFVLRVFHVFASGRMTYNDAT